MIIPITKGQATAPGAPTQGMPSETNLLMALATMHEQGRFDEPSTYRRSPLEDTPDKSWFSGMKAKGLPLGHDPLNPKDLFEDPATGRVGRRT